jgi:hypothetical protein
MPLDADYLSSYRLTHAQAAALLGMHPITVSTWESQGKLPIVARHARANLLRPDVETWAASRWRHGEPGWVTISGAAPLLGVTRAWVTHLAQRDRLPLSGTATDTSSSGWSRCGSRGRRGGHSGEPIGDH